MDLHSDQRRLFLQLVPEDRRSHLANVLLGEVRAGAHLPTAVVDGAIATLRAHVGPWGREDPAIAALLAVLLQHRADALLFAAWCLEWERLPAAEKARLKAARGEEHRRQYLAGQPATPKQVAYCRALGYRGEVASKQHASELIDQLRQRRAS